MKTTRDDDDALLALMRRIADGDGDRRVLGPAVKQARAVLQRGAGAKTGGVAGDTFFDRVKHYVYAGDTLLHVAACAHRPTIARALVDSGADVRAKNRRGATPLHYAADGAASIDAPDQVAVIAVLLAAGADVDAADKSGTTPLQRAVRNRCAAAVRALLDAGADPARDNCRGSSARTLAHVTSGKSGSGSDAAKAEQQAIAHMLR